MVRFHATYITSLDQVGPEALRHDPFSQNMWPFDSASGDKSVLYLVEKLGLESEC